MKVPYSKTATNEEAASIADPTALRLEWSLTGDDFAPYQNCC